MHFLRASAGSAAVNLAREELEQLGSTFRAPRRGVRHARAVVEHERIRQRVRRDFALVVIEAGGIRREGRNERGEGKHGAGDASEAQGHARKIARADALRKCETARFPVWKVAAAR